MEMIDLCDLWGKLEREVETTGRPGRLKRLVLKEAPCRIFVGISAEDNKRFFSIQHKTFGLAPSDIPRLKGLSVSVEVVDCEGENQQKISFSPGDNSLNAPFDAFIQDMCDFILKDGNSKNVYSVVLTRLLLWQKFFEKIPAEGLSVVQRQGLFGELWLLRKLILDGINLDKCVMAWKGPFAAHQDFVFVNASIEVKTVSSKEHQKIRIASERQLDERLCRRLYVAQLSIGEVEYKGTSLCDLVCELKKIIGKKASLLTTFEEALISSGYIDVHGNIYKKPKYQIREDKYFHVKDEFPRIREDEVRKGVGDISYTVVISACLDYIVNYSTVLADIKD